MGFNFLISPFMNIDFRCFFSFLVIDRLHTQKDRDTNCMEFYDAHGIKVWDWILGVFVWGTLVHCLKAAATSKLARVGDSSATTHIRHRVRNCTYFTSLFQNFCFKLLVHQKNDFVQNQMVLYLPTSMSRPYL